MFHLHHLIFLPFLILFHDVGLAFLAFAALILVKAIRRRRCNRASHVGGPRKPARSGNEAFDDYRSATLRKLEAEAEEFRKYLDRLRQAADRAAFEAFLKSRRAENGPVS